MLFNCLYQIPAEPFIALFSQPATDDCRACEQFFEKTKIKLGSPEGLAVVSAHRCVATDWPLISGPLDGLRSTNRWKDLFGKKIPHNSLEHSLRLTHLINHLARGTAGLTHDDVVWCTRKGPFHDFNEVPMGDMLYTAKSHPLFESIYPPVENELTKLLFGEIEGNSQELWQIFAEEGTRRSKLFRWGERLDYLLYCCAEMEAGCPVENVVATGVFGKTWPALKQAAEEFPVLAPFLDERAEKIEAALEAYRRSGRGDPSRRFVELNEAHLRIMLQALTNLCEKYRKKNSAGLPAEFKGELAALARRFG